MNEGCAGGWGIMNGFFAENADLVSESCAPYKARTKNDNCSNYKGCEPIARVKQSYYLNDYNYSPTVTQI
jgi:hypothetical protein